MNDKKELMKSNDKIIEGVCGGIAEYFGWDKAIVRIVIAVLILSTGTLPGLILYVIAAIVMPKPPKQTKEVTKPNDFDDGTIEAEFREK